MYKIPIMRLIRFVCLLSLLFLVVFNTYAQVEISLDKKRIAIHLPLYEITKVVDAREDKRNIGEVQKGINNKNKTSYIYQEDLIESIESKNKNVTLKNIKIAIEELIKKIENCG